MPLQEDIFDTYIPLPEGGHIDGVSKAFAEQPSPQVAEMMRFLSEPEGKELIPDPSRSGQQPVAQQAPPAPKEGSGNISLPSPAQAPVRQEMPGVADQYRVGDIERAAAETHRTPTEPQKEAGNYKKGKVGLHGITISIENPKGSTRSGVSPDGKPWSVTMGAHYGYILGTVGKDKDHVDCFLGPHPESEIVFVVDQEKMDGSFDEHKCCLGWFSETEARKGYLENYTSGWRCGKITAMTMEQFRRWLSSDNTKSPAAFAIRYAREPAKPKRSILDWARKLVGAIPTPNITVNVPEQRTPEVTVELPSASPPVVNVQIPVQEPPNVTVHAPVEVNLPEQKPATVNVTVEQKPMRRTVERDAEGHIKGIVERTE